MTPFDSPRPGPGRGVGGLAVMPGAVCVGNPCPALWKVKGMVPEWEDAVAATWTEARCDTGCMGVGVETLTSTGVVTLQATTRCFIHSDSADVADLAQGTIWDWRDPNSTTARVLLEMRALVSEVLEQWGVDRDE